MRRSLKIAAGVVVTLLLLALCLPFLIDANRFRPMLESKLHQALGREVKIGDLKLAIFSGGATAGDLSIADDPAFGTAPFLKAKSLHVGVSLPALLFTRKLKVTSVTLDQPQVRLLQSPSGDWNFSSLGTRSAVGQVSVPPAASGSGLDMAVSLVKISQGRVTIGRIGGHLKPLLVEEVNGELHDFAADQSFPFSLAMKVVGGGAVKLDGKAGPIDQDDVALTPATLSLKIDGLDFAGSGLNEIAPAAAGLIAFDGHGENGVHGIQIGGKLKIDKWKVSPKGKLSNRAVTLDFRFTHDLKKRAGNVDEAHLNIGDAALRLTGTYEPEDEYLVLHGRFDGAKMPVGEMAEMLPALGISLPAGSSLKNGSAEITGTIEGRLDRLVTSGTVRVTNARLEGFNLSSRMSAIERLAGIRSEPNTEIQEFSGTVKISPEGIGAGQIKLVLPAVGEVTGDGMVKADDTLNFKMLAAVHAGGVAAVLNKTPVPFTVEGTATDPVFHPDLKAVMKEEMRGVGSALKELVSGRK